MLLKFGFNIRTQKRTIREGNALIVIKKNMYTVDADKDFFLSNTLTCMQDYFKTTIFEYFVIVNFDFFIQRMRKNTCFMYMAIMYSRAHV